MLFAFLKAPISNLDPDLGSKRSMRITIRRARLLTACWAVFMLALTSWPSPPEVPVVSHIPNFDKVVHAFLYGVLGFLASFAVRWPPGRSRPLLRR